MSNKINFNKFSSRTNPNLKSFRIFSPRTKKIALQMGFLCKISRLFPGPPKREKPHMAISIPSGTGGSVAFFLFIFSRKKRPPPVIFPRGEINLEPFFSVVPFSHVWFQFHFTWLCNGHSFPIEFLWLIRFATFSH